MENFLKILTSPDNIPVALMCLVAIYLCWFSFKKALKNDKLISGNKVDEVINEMEK